MLMTRPKSVSKNAPINLGLTPKIQRESAFLDALLTSMEKIRHANVSQTALSGTPLQMT